MPLVSQRVIDDRGQGAGQLTLDLRFLNCRMLVLLVDHGLRDRKLPLKLTVHLRKLPILLRNRIVPRALFATHFILFHEAKYLLHDRYEFRPVQVQRDVFRIIPFRRFQAVLDEVLDPLLL